MHPPSQTRPLRFATTASRGALRRGTAALLRRGSAACAMLRLCNPAGLATRDPGSPDPRDRTRTPLREAVPKFWVVAHFGIDVVRHRKAGAMVRSVLGDQPVGYVARGPLEVDDVFGLDRYGVDRRQPRLSSQQMPDIVLDSRWQVLQGIHDAAPVERRLMGSQCDLDPGVVVPVR